MDLSRGPIREALNRLDVEGYVNIIPNKGTVVHEVSQKEISDTFDFFNILYCELIISVIDKISPTELDPYIENLMSIVPDRINKYNLMDAKINHDNGVYAFLINKYKNGVFAKHFNILHDKIHWYRNISIIERPFKNSINDRLAMLNSIKKKNKRIIHETVSKNSYDSKKYSVV